MNKEKLKNKKIPSQTPVENKTEQGKESFNTLRDNLVKFFETKKGQECLENMNLREIAEFKKVSLTTVHKARMIFLARNADKFGEGSVDKDILRKELIKIKKRVNFLINNV
jgi:hypothetical protein